MIKRGGNEYLDWGVSNWGGKRGHAGSEAYRRDLEEHLKSESAIDNVPTPAEMIQNVPTPSAVRPGAGADDVRSVPGNVAIHINGSSHDPEALANLVQRRIDESMNWRLHDTSSEYT
ncbi:hypothetical protein [Bradyrhizobium sp. RDM4]|uniref:hypothetical protein n=1 Tax=Bradyrhizobium sp. RDM4 TaxID=3378765 RepID=UPI0038FC0471